MGSQRQIKTVVIIGSGNVARHMAMALYKAGVQVTGVCSQHLSHARELAGEVKAVALDQCNEMNPQADLYLLAVPDGKMATVAKAMPAVSGLVCHTSGITPLDALHRFERYGVFYPLQTFSKNKAVDMREVPFCLEASSSADYAALQQVAQKLGRHVYPVSTEKRMKLHLAAVLVNNFTNHLFALAEAFLEENGLDKEMLMPLIRETVDKLHDLPATEAQSGPARRGDRVTLSKHLEMLKDNPGLKAIYQLFSEQILKKYHG